MTISFKITGLDEFKKKLNNLNSDIDKLSGEHAISFNELFSVSFMRKHTQFSSIDEMVNKSPFRVESEEDFERIPDAEWDTYVKAKTSFDSWQEMQSKAAQEYFGKKVQAAFKK
jgi:hypothetical protein